MFRRRVLEKRNEPDALDELLVVVSPRASLAVAALAGVVAIAIAWSLLAKIPVKVVGQGILMRPGLVVDVQGDEEGRVAAVLAAPGERVSAGQPLLRLSKVATERELNRLNIEFDIRRDFVEGQNARAIGARALETELANARRSTLTRELASLEALRDRSVAQRGEAVRQRRETLADIEALLERQRAEQQDRMEGITSLRNRGVANNATLISALTAVTASEIEAARTALQVSETRLSEIEIVNEELRLFREIQTARAELSQIEIEEQRAERELSQFLQDRQQGLDELAAQIRAIRHELDAARVLVSPFDGVILEMLTADSGLVSVGSTVATMSIDAQRPFLRVRVASDAKLGTFRLIVNGLTTRPIPANAEAEELVASLAELGLEADLALRAGTTLADGPVDVHFLFDESASLRQRKVVELRDTELWTTAGRPATASATLLGGEIPDVPLAHLGFFPIGLGKQILPGMEVRIDPSSVQRDRFGSLVGTVTDVSDFAVTDEGLRRTVGNTSVAEALSAAGAVIQVDATLTLDPDDPSGFEWTSNSPDFAITEGTTTTADVIVEKRRPITFVLPLLRSWLLGESSTVAPINAAAQ